MKNLFEQFLSVIFDRILKKYTDLINEIRKSKDDIIKEIRTQKLSEKSKENTDKNTKKENIIKFISALNETDIENIYLNNEKIYIDSNKKITDLLQKITAEYIQEKDSNDTINILSEKLYRDLYDILLKSKNEKYVSYLENRKLEEVTELYNEYLNADENTNNLYHNINSYKILCFLAYFVGYCNSDDNDDTNKQILLSLIENSKHNYDKDINSYNNHKTLIANISKIIKLQEELKTLNDNISVYDGFIYDLNDENKNSEETIKIINDKLSINYNKAVNFKKCDYPYTYNTYLTETNNMKKNITDRQNSLLYIQLLNFYDKNNIFSEIQKITDDINNHKEKIKQIGRTIKESTPDFNSNEFCWTDYNSENDDIIKSFTPRECSFPSLIFTQNNEKITVIKGAYKDEQN